jgi:hypothetical protein
MTYLVYVVIDDLNGSLDTIWDDHNSAGKRRDDLNDKAQNRSSWRIQTVAVNTGEPK